MSSIKIKNNIDSELTIAHRDGAKAKTIYTDEMAVSVATVALMEAIGTPSDGDTVIVKDMDRGGIFVYDSAAVDNQGTVFNGWVRQYDGAVNVKWFGYDGTTSCILLAMGHHDLYVPEADYEGSIRMDGLTFARTIRFAPGARVIASSEEYALQLSTVSNLTIIGGTFTSINRVNNPVDIFKCFNINFDGTISMFGTKHSGSTMVYSKSAFQITSSNNIMLNNIEAYNIDGCGIYVNAIRGSVNTGDCFNIKILNSLIRDNITGVIAGESSATEEGSVYAVTIDGNTIQDNNAAGSVSGGDGVLLTGYTSLAGDSGSKYIITNNTISGSGEHGTYLHGREIIVSNNLVFGNFSSGIKMGKVSYATVDGNIMSDNGYSTGGAHIYIQSTYRNMVVSNNVVKLDIGNESHGIRLAYNDDMVEEAIEALDDVVHRNMVVTGNVIENIGTLSETGGIAVEVNHSMSITGNTILNGGMSLAPSGAVASNKVVVTGNIMKDGTLSSSGGAYTAIISNNIMKDFQANMTADNVGTRVVGNTILDMTTNNVTIDGSDYMVGNDITSSATSGTLIKYYSAQTREDNSPWTFSFNTVTTAGAALCNFSYLNTGYNTIITNNRFYANGATVGWLGISYISASIISENIVLGANETLFKDSSQYVCGCIVKNNIANMPATFTDYGGCTQSSVIADNIVNVRAI